MKQEYLDSDIQNIYDNQVSLEISHVYHRNFYGWIKYYGGANLIMMQPKMFKAIFFSLQDKEIIEMRSFNKKLELDQSSHIIPMESRNLILISRKNEFLDIIDINTIETLFTLRLQCSQQYSGFQLGNSSTIQLIYQQQGQIRSFCLLRFKFITKVQFKEFIGIEEPQFSKYYLHLESQNFIYILKTKTMKIISRFRKYSLFINCLTQIIVPHQFSCKNIDLLQVPSISNLNNIRTNFRQWLYIEKSKVWCILQDDFLSIFNTKFKLIQQIMIKKNYQPINLEYDSQSLKIFYRKKRKF
ncbi:hypothetical protein pb186bvf_018932 [Paramecium bursaria]